MLTERRNNGIDFLKILCMLMIVSLHITGIGGAMVECSSRGSYLILMVSRTICYGAVDCFAMISGFVGNAKGKHFLANVLLIWITIIFYTILITFVKGFVFRLPLYTSDWMNAILPISRNIYWYLTCFIGMSLFIPFIEYGFQHITKRKFTLIGLIMFLAFSMVPMFLGEEKFGVNLGYSVLWLMIMYIFGAYVRMFGTKIQLAHSKWIGLFFGSAILAAVVQWGRETERIRLYLLEYTNPLIVISSIFLLLAFKDLNIKKPIVKIQRWIIPLNLSVYIIHMNPFLNDAIIKNKFVFVGQNNPIVSVLLMIIFTLLCYVACIIIDLPRFFIFKILSIKDLFIKINDKLNAK